ncbi:MAG: radical SAM family heme chaperone HemW [Fimbriimonadaceae bacterium]|nr:radical SAM family heme chaperone HemW [Fimbriimonadaceae bacterium]
MNPIAVYVHTPFCPSKCGYCDFNSYAMQGDIVERTTEAMIRELKTSRWRGQPAKTIFIGGGTPTFLSEALIVKLIHAILDAHPPVEGCEITSEANPGTVDIPKFEAMRKAGVNRISLGAQSFLDRDLKQLERVHQANDIGRAVGSAREAGFENLNLDLMFALPGQKSEGWQRNLETAIGLGPDHLSLYCLTIEPNTRFYKLYHKGLLKLPSDEDQVSMYDYTLDFMASAGYFQYEISNFAKPGRQCQHNLCYWHGEDYLGYGPGAVGCVSVDESRVRYTNLKHPKGYSEAVEQGAPLWCEQESLTPDAERLEKIMLGLRLDEGLISDGLELDSAQLSALEERGWIEKAGDRVKLTRTGKHFCSEAVLSLA